MEPPGGSAAAQMSQQGMIVAGVMSGTSADGIDVALVKISESTLNSEAGGGRAIQLLGHATYSYSPRVREAILAQFPSG